MDDILHASGPLMLIAIAAIYAIFFGYVCGAVARAKSLNVNTWQMLGVFFGLLALIAIAVMPATRPPEKLDTE
jgi:membrane protein implicated in regulation of membrane protease activity